MTENTVLDNNVSSIIKFKDKDGNNYPEWEEKRLGELFDIFVGGDLDKEHSSKYQTKTYCYPVFANALIDDGLYGYADYYKNTGDTITVTGRGDVGHAVARHCSYVPIVRLLVLVPRHKECVDFFAYQINVTKIFVESTGVPQLTSPQLSKVKMKCPCFAEQEKIASFLTSIDNLISTQESNISILETYNRGLISKIFKQEIRFKDDNGNEFPTWEEKALDQVCEYVDYRGKTPKKQNSGVQLITAKNIRNGYIDYDISKEYIDPNDYDDVMHRGFPELGDVLITTEAPCGYVAQIDSTNIALAQRVIKYRGHKDIINNTFLKYVLLSEGFQTTLLQKASGGTVKGIKGSILHKLKIPVPFLEEQQKIADCLSAIDKMLEQEKVYLEQLKTIKKGLLQQMFV